MSNEQQWEEVGQEAAAERDYNMFSFKEHGDACTGKLVKILKDLPGTYGPETHYIWDSPNGKFGVNPNADLRKRYSALQLGDIARTTYVSDKDIGKPSPMKQFKVEKFKGKGAAPAPKPADSDIPF